MFRHLQKMRFFSPACSSITISQLTPTSKLSEFALLCRRTFQSTYPTLFTNDDIETIYQDFANTLFDEISTGKYVYLSASHNGKYVGYAKLNASQTSNAELEKLYVLKEYHQQGVGSQLMMKAIEIALQQNKTSLSLFVWNENNSAIKFYESRGFHVTEQTTKSFGATQVNGFVMSIPHLDLWLLNQHASNNRNNHNNNIRKHF